MGITKAISSKANLKQQTTADLPINPFQVVSEMYGPVTTTAGQTIINIAPISVDTTNAINFLLIVDGKILTLGALNDYTFTNVSPNGTSSQVTLTQPLASGLNLFAIYLGVVQPTQSASSLSTLQAQVNSVPQTTVLTSGSGIYTVPTGAVWLEIEAIGGGGGGGGDGASGPTPGGNGGDTTFGPMTAGGGTGGGFNGGSAGPGGTASLGVGPVGIALAGGYGSSGTNIAFNNGLAGGSGAYTPFGGAGAGGVGGQDGFSAIANTGAGGGGGGGNSTVGAANGGGGGGYIKASIFSPSSTYSYSVGTAGTAGTAGSSGHNGGAGGSGIIIITAHFLG